MIIVNGEEQAYEAVSVGALIQAGGYRLETIAVEINEEIVPKAQYNQTMLSDGDRIEIIHFVGGG